MFSLLMLILTFILFFTIFVSPLFYAVILLLVRGYVIFHLTVSSIMPGLISLLILLVYYRAIIILICYVCSISPNVSYEKVSTLSSTRVFIFCLVIRSAVSIAIPTQFSTSFSNLQLVSFFYSYLGSSMLLFICGIMLLVLFFCSLYTHVSSPFRSV